MANPFIQRNDIIQVIDFQLSFRLVLWTYATLWLMNLNPDYQNASVRQIGVIIAATGLVTGVFDITQAGASFGIIIAGMTLIWLGSLEN